MFSLPEGKKVFTVWKPDLQLLFNIDNFDSLTGKTLEDTIATKLPPAAQVSGKMLLHQGKIIKIQVKRQHE